MSMITKGREEMAMAMDTAMDTARPRRRVRPQIQQRREREQGELRALILKEAAALFLEVGYERFSVRHLADRIGYSATTVYLYFTDKDGLFQAVVDEGFARFIARLRAAAESADGPLERLERLGEAYVRFGLQEPGYYRLMFLRRSDFLAGPAAGSTRPRIAALDILPDAVRQAMDAGAVHPGDAAATADALWALMHGVVALAIEMPTFDEARVARAVTAALDLGRRGLGVR